MKKVAVIMGSDSDFPVVKKALEELKAYGVEFECHVMSAHRSPALAAEFAAGAKDNDFGGAQLDGLDALLATVMMPSGIPVATVAVDGAKNAAILAIQILALSDEVLATKLLKAKQDMLNGVIAKDKALQEQIELL